MILMRYREWVENRKYVHEKSNGNSDMCIYLIWDRTIFWFLRFIWLRILPRDGLIVDIRATEVVMFHSLYLKSFPGKQLWLWFRDTVHRYIPEVIVHLVQPYAWLTNIRIRRRHFSHNFKQMKLGTLVGKRTGGVDWN